MSTTKQRPKAAKVLRLVPPQPAPEDPQPKPCADTIKHLREALADAEAGRLRGVILATLYGGGGYTVALTGSAYRVPTYSLGIVSVLHRKVGDMVPSV